MADRLERLVLDHHAGVYRYAFRLAGNAVDADDLTQQTFLVAQEHASEIRDDAKAGAWLRTVLRNLYLRQRQRAPTLASDVALSLDAIAEPDAAAAHWDAPARFDGPLDALFDRERLQRALDALADDFRVVLLMYYFEELSYQEIADALQVPIGTIMSRLSRAKSHLKQRLCDLARD